MQFASPVQLVGQIADEPLQRYGLQEGEAPALPAARMAQVPVPQ